MSQLLLISPCSIEPTGSSSNKCTPSEGTTKCTAHSSAQFARFFTSQASEHPLASSPKKSRCWRSTSSDAQDERSSSKSLVFLAHLSTNFNRVLYSQISSWPDMNFLIFNYKQD